MEEMADIRLLATFWYHTVFHLGIVDGRAPENQLKSTRHSRKSTHP